MKSSFYLKQDKEYDQFVIMFLETYFESKGIDFDGCNTEINEDNKLLLDEKSERLNIKDFIYIFSIVSLCWKLLLSNSTLENFINKISLNTFEINCTQFWSLYLERITVVTEKCFKFF